MAYNRTSIRPIGGGFNAGETRWTPILTFNSTPSSATTITLSSASGVGNGFPLRYTTVAGGASTYYYAIISGISGNVLTIQGLSLSGVTISALWLGDPELIVQVDFYIPGTYATSTTMTALASIAKQTFAWKFASAAIVNFRAGVITLGDGTAVVNVSFDTGGGGVNIDGTGVICLTGSGGSSSNIQNPTILYNTAVEIVVSTSDTASSDLTVSCTFVLA